MKECQLQIPQRGVKRVTDLAGIPNFGCIHVQQSHEFGHVNNHLQVYQYVDLPSSPSTRLLTDITRKDGKGNEEARVAS
jgi:hypothetical protein